MDLQYQKNKPQVVTKKIVVNSHGHNFECYIIRTNNYGYAAIKNLDLVMIQLSLSDCDENAGVLFRLFKEIKSSTSHLPESDIEISEIAYDISKTITPLFSRLDSFSITCSALIRNGDGRKVKIEKE